MAFDRQIASALKLIKKNGQLITWRQPAAVVPVDTPWLPSNDTPVDNPAYVCFVPVKDRATRLFLAYIKGGDVVQGQLAGIMGNVPFTPSLKDVVIRDGVELSIASIDLLSPNGQQILWMIEFNG